MACYAALLSLDQTIHHIKNHPHPPISLDQNQVGFLTQNLTFFQHHLESYPTYEDDDLESRIIAAAYAAEDLIETHIFDQIHAGSNISTIDLHQGLESVIGDMDLIKKEAMKIMMIKEKIKGAQHNSPLHTNSSVSTASVGPASAGQSSSKERFDDVFTNKVLDKLTGQQCGLQIIAIVGMGGIGKTTLATNIYTKSIIVERFDIRAWVTISQEYSRGNTLRVLCKETNAINDDLIGVTSEDELGERVYKKLWGRRFLIVMDDMWSVEAYDIVKSFFPNNNNGSRILITTRLSNLASQLSSSDAFQMQFLDIEKSWDLLCETVFGKLDCPNELVKIGKEIATNCRGLPLSIVVVGGLLKKSKGTQAHWEYTLENLNSLINLEDAEYCLQILRTSYKELPIQLKPCFLYMGVFPEDFEINVPKLIKLWVSEGILKPIDNKSLEEVAEEYLKELIQRNLILVHELRWSGEAKRCKIHDLLRDVCLREAKKHKFLCVIRQQKHHIPQGIDTERHICIDHSEATEEYSPEFLHAAECASRSRSLLYCRRGFSDKDSPSLFFGLLRVYSPVVKYGSMVTCSHNLIFKHANLRYLSLNLNSGSALRLFSLSSLLWNLQTLNAHGLNLLEHVFTFEIWEMPLLRHVTVGKCAIPEPPNEVDNFVLENLQTLSRIINFKFSEEAIRRIPNIKKMKLTYKNDGLNRLPDLNLNNLGRLQKLESLFLEVSIIDHCDHEKIMRNLVSFPHSLKKLNLIGTKLSWEELTIRIGSLPLLQILKLNWKACAGPTWETVEGQFCSLRVLHIAYCGITHWDTDNTHFPLLEHLLLHSIELEEIPSSIGDISTLKSIQLVHCNKTAADSARRIQEEQEENGNEDLQVVIDSSFLEEYQAHLDEENQEEDQVESDEEDQNDWGNDSGDHEAEQH